MTVMLYKQGADAGEKGAKFALSSGSVSVDGDLFDWIIVDDTRDDDEKSPNLDAALKAGWSRKAKAKVKK